MKKKILSLVLVVALAATAVIGGTLAYFSDADQDVNVMTTANIHIVQNETERDGTQYEDGQKLYPAVYLDENGKPYGIPAGSIEGPKTLTTFTGPGGEDMRMYTSLNNEIDKVVSVTNNGDIEAYVRTIVLFENTDHMLKDKLHINYSSAPWVRTSENIEVDGQLYQVDVYTLKTTLAAGKTSPASLKQIWLNPNTDSEWYKNLGDDGQLSIIALSQACQTAGFTSADEALNTAFGEVNAGNLAAWIAKTGIDTTDAANVVGGGATTNP